MLEIFKTPWVAFTFSIITLCYSGFVEEEEEKALKLFANMKFLPYRDLHFSKRQKGFVKDLFEKLVRISMCIFSMF